MSERTPLNFGFPRGSRGQAKRSANREDSAALLDEAGVRYESKNDGAHLIVTGGGFTVDFWPGTGRWIVRGDTAPRFGVRGLIAFILGPSER